MLVGLRVSAPVDTDDAAIASEDMKCYCPAVGASECDLICDCTVAMWNCSLGVRRE